VHSPATLQRLEEGFWGVVRRLGSALSPEVEAGVTIGQYRVLQVLHARGRATVGEVAEALGVTLSAVTALLDRLARAGLVTRRRGSRDRRRVWVSLAPRGRQAFEAARIRRQAMLERFCADLAPADLERLVAILERLAGRGEGE